MDLSAWARLFPFHQGSLAHGQCPGITGSSHVVILGGRTTPSCMVLRISLPIRCVGEDRRREDVYTGRASADSRGDKELFARVYVGHLVGRHVLSSRRNTAKSGNYFRQWV